MNDKVPMGFLLGKVAFFSPTDIDNLIDNLTKEQSYIMIINAIEYGYNKGLFTLEESELLSKSIRIVRSDIGDNI